MQSLFNLCLRWAPLYGIRENGILILKSQITIYPLMYVKFICLLLQVGYLNQFLSPPKWSPLMAPTVLENNN